MREGVHGLLRDKMRPSGKPPLATTVIERVIALTGNDPPGEAGQIIFEEFGGGPGNSYTWVELKDDLTVSLLQARLVELNLPINVKIAGLLRDSA